MTQQEILVVAAFVDPSTDTAYDGTEFITTEDRVNEMTCNPQRYGWKSCERHHKYDVDRGDFVFLRITVNPAL